MSVRFQHDPIQNACYFITFTCYKWLPLLEAANAYDTVYKWFDHLYENRIYVTGYVIMPNHLHVLLYFPCMTKSLNLIISNAKRIMAYQIIRRLKDMEANELLTILCSGVKEREARKGQKRKVFEESFDAKECYSEKFIFQKLQYMHENPVSKKWNLINDFTGYNHSSASFYELGIKKYKNVLHINDALSGQFPGSLLHAGSE